MREPIQAPAQQAQEGLAQATTLRSSTRERLASVLPQAPSAHTLSIPNPHDSSKAKSFVLVKSSMHTIAPWRP